ncbi:MAG: hypothetical protein C0404_09055 [Verrucomicrobia bacterium]|nr:hypothetical protein [Verrucomicrobiota bacterium]
MADEKDKKREGEVPIMECNGLTSAVLFMTAFLVTGLANAGESSKDKADGKIALPDAAKAGHRDFEHTTLGGSVHIEHAAFLGAVDSLDGPAREAMHRGIFAVTGDGAGNLYFYEHSSNCIRALRKRDGRIFTLSGNRYIASGRPGKGGMADSLKLFHECFITMPSMAAVGNPLEGDGSLYVTDDSCAVVRLWRDKGVWRYELAAGLGKGKPADGAMATEIGFSRSALVATEKGEIGLIAGTQKSAALYWLRGGKLHAAYDHAAVEKELGTTFYCRGIDVNGSFAGAAGGEYTGAQNCIAVVSPDGKRVRKVPTPYAPQWTICADAKSERWFFRACDDYSIQYADSAGGCFRLLRDGTWKPLTGKVGNRGSNEGLNWSRGITLPDGRYAGWSGHGCSPVFTATWLDKGGK